MRFCRCSPTALSWLLLLLLVGNAVSEPEEYKTYIIHMDHSQKPLSFLTHESWHRSTLRSLSKPVDDHELFLYSYNHAMHGFSARLTPSQVSEIRKSPAHLAIHEESFGKLLTTHSPKFLGLRHSSGLWPASSYGEGVIIGLIDSGVWPESESFNDRGMPPIPQRWKGKCENSTTSPFPCNKKLIGARTFIKAIQVNNSDQADNSPRDFLGHGTHTSSTAVGNHVPGASQFGYAKGIARGMAPRAHLAMYKVSNTEDIAESDVLAAMDQAIADGVDIMSLSLGFGQTPYFRDVIAIASLLACEKGIVVVCAAGNQGAYNSTENAAPWITTVGAGTLDRSFIGTVTLGNGLTLEGKSTFPESVLITNASLYYGKGDSRKTLCQIGSLNKNETTGKVVFCDNAGITIISEQISELYRIGANAGIVVADRIPFGALDDLTIPILALPISSGTLIREYIIGESKAEVTMRFVLTSLGTKLAPEVAFFSSRGPNPINPAILKPDVIAPGVDVLAAVPPFPKIRIGDYVLVTDYAFKLGTSMATPHVSGVAALLKAVHPDWSPAAIRSALMTTAYTINNNGTSLTNQLYAPPATPLDYGAGHINPNKALDPGLIYDMDTQDYIDFLCGLGYNDTEMRAVLRQSQWNCTQKETDLNYPSFVAIFSEEANSPKVKNFSRVVTNVGEDQSVYQAVVGNSTALTVRVEPSTLTFTKKYQKLSFNVSIEIDRTAPPQTYGYLKWIDQRNRTVSSPIVVLFS
ncbi:hypothetical protein CRYUN_Cryun30bG0036000 [Craigia yunnanensis]